MDTIPADTGIFTGPHSSSAARELALAGTILRTQVGSGVHGVTTSNDDRDEMGICIEPPEYVIGLRRFEQYEYRTQPQGVRSGAGDLDLVIYSLRKWLRLALQGNPTVLLPMFVPDSEVVVATGPGRYLRGHPELVLSRQAAHRFIGYLRSQREQMLGLRAQRHTNRPELVERYGFDTKFAYHMVRLGVQGVELLTTGRITLPMPEPWRSDLTALRRGEMTKEWALAAADDAEAALVRLAECSALPEALDRDAADRWLIDTYQAAWRHQPGPPGSALLEG